MNKIKRIYDELLAIHGKQGWWPVTPTTQKKQPPAYGIKTKTNKQRLEIIVGAVLTQNTQWKPNVEKAIIELNRSNLIDVDKILKTKRELIARAIKSSGYFNQKAKKLKNVAKLLKKNPIQKLRKTNLQEARKLLLKVNGIGPETADSILLYALDKPAFVVDAYTKRIFENLNFIKPNATYDEVQKLFTENLEKNPKLFNEYHALIVAHAKKHHKKKTERTLCPLIKKYAHD